MIITVVINLAQLIPTVNNNISSIMIIDINIASKRSSTCNRTRKQLIIHIMISHLFLLEFKTLATHLIFKQPTLPCRIFHIRTQELLCMYAWSIVLINTVIQQPGKHEGAGTFASDRSYHSHFISELEIFTHTHAFILYSH